MMPRSLSTVLLAISLFLSPALHGQALVQHPQPDAELSDRWQWALQQIRNGTGNGWIAYSFNTSLDERLDPITAVHANNVIRWNSQSISRRENVNRHWQTKPWMPGASIRSLTQAAGGPGPTHRVRELMPIARIENNVLQSISLAAADSVQQWSGDSIYWLGSADGRSSFQMLASQLTVVQIPRLQRALVRTLGVHSTAARSTDLWALYTDPQSRIPQPWIVESLAMETSDTMRSRLEGIAMDQNAPVIPRRIAIAALSRYQNDRVEALLLELAGNYQPRSIRLEAIESLGFFPSTTVSALLQDIIDGSADSELQQQALASLAFMPGSYSLLVEHTRSHTDSSVRRQALRLLFAVDSQTAIADLAWSVENDASDKLQRTAIEILDEGPPDRVVPILFSVIADPAAYTDRVRCEAIESLGEFNRPEVLQRLREVVWSEERDCMGREAIDSLGAMKSAEGNAILLDVARNHPGSRQRAEAVERLQENYFERLGSGILSGNL